ASGQLLFNSSRFTGPTDVNTNTSLSGADFSTAGFADNFDIGNVLPVGLLAPQLTSDLTVKYQIFGQGGLRNADVIVPEPVGLGLLGLGVAGLLARRRKSARGPRQTV